MHVGVNVEFPDRIRRPNYAPFSVDIKPMLSGRNFSTIDYNVCLSWQADNTKILKSSRSGSVMIEIQIPTGYRVEEKDLKLMIWGYYIQNLREAENWPGQVNFGFEYIDFNPICFQFQAKRWIPVANISRYYEVKAYEWFEPGNMYRNVYTLRNLFALDICEVNFFFKTKQKKILVLFFLNQVCGSYQCPYCPYYSQASILLQSITMIIFILILLISDEINRCII
jgi:hypothetical protein